ncbi:MAG TPA: hypothetical protein PKD54_04070 [Pirellulaceae bacterium]|nr:hypothetical protein [Pirellulaceae bacterium]
MKRIAAIVGPTPPHIRWSLLQSCRLRPAVRNDQPDSVFRQLRSLHELSNAYQQNRVLDGIAWHESCLPPAEMTSDLVALPENDLVPRGCFVEEVLNVYGGVEFVTNQCSVCLANTFKGQHGWAGCVGTLSGWSVRSSGGGDPYPNLFDWLDGKYGAMDWHWWREQCQVETNPHWYGLWLRSPIDPQVLPFVGQIMDTALASIAQLDASARNDLSRFCTAVALAMEHHIPLSVISVPPGFSDGVTWTISAHCQHCHAPRGTGAPICAVCKVSAPVEPARKRKVLGLRPYLGLESLIGPSAARQALSRFWQLHKR